MNPSEKISPDKDTTPLSRRTWLEVITGTWIAIVLGWTTVLQLKSSENIEQTKKAVEWIISEGGKITMDIIVSPSGQVKCLSGQKNFPTTTSHIGVHPLNKRWYDATPAFHNLKVEETVQVRFSTNSDYLIITKDGIEVFKSFVWSWKLQVKQRISDNDELAMRVQACEMIQY